MNDCLYHTHSMFYPCENGVFLTDYLMTHGTPVEPVSNTFLANPVPREGFIDARRDDGCVPVITDLVLS